jgi:hypothetical protein
MFNSILNLVLIICFRFFADISEMGSKFEKQLGELSSKQSNQSSEVGTSNAAAPSLLAGATTAVAAACDTLQTLTERLISATSQLREHLVVDGKPAPLVTVLRQSGSLDVILNLARGLFEFLVRLYVFAFSFKTFVWLTQYGVCLHQNSTRTRRLNRLPRRRRHRWLTCSTI